MSGWKMVTQLETPILLKWIRAIFTKPLTIIKSIYFNIRGEHEDLLSARLRICNGCDRKEQWNIGKVSMDICGECGCILENKTRIIDEHCDLCKW